MHLLAEQSTALECSAETAYQYVANLERFGEWFPGVVAIASANDRPHGEPGKTYLETVAIPLRGTRKIMLTVVDARPNQRLVTEGAFLPLLPRMEIDFEPTAAHACRIRWRMFSRNTHPLMRATLIPLTRRIMQRRARLGIARLKIRLDRAQP
ncbi:SRPBCC family protein [Sinimarinibacterium sp. CAU 1509]|uniref:SRPBCC family protein n=1 Tax=Sinimarinibacterium sp. CAU 1509 TaxID=2562283 RepID=UPI0010AD1E7E|nr:SRPBCC family protein [Sinimarinibacterium sp. CAU 1509]TJY55179.1 SRPBCC family protein [Sinimarinibacterium sp. CAU 1509]